MLQVCDKHGAFVQQFNASARGPYKPLTGRTVYTGQCMNHSVFLDAVECGMNHAPAILAAPAVYCIPGRIKLSSDDARCLLKIQVTA